MNDLSSSFFVTPFIQCSRFPDVFVLKFRPNVEFPSHDKDNLFSDVRYSMKTLRHMYSGLNRYLMSKPSLLSLVVPNLKQVYLNQWYNIPSIQLTRSVFLFQRKCCGVRDSTDYFNSKWRNSSFAKTPEVKEVPNTCCVLNNENVSNTHNLQHISLRLCTGNN